MGGDYGISYCPTVVSQMSEAGNRGLASTTCSLHYGGDIESNPEVNVEVELSIKVMLKS